MIHQTMDLQNQMTFKGGAVDDNVKVIKITAPIPKEHEELDSLEDFGGDDINMTSVDLDDLI